MDSSRTLHTYVADVEQVQQVFGNIVSVGLIPLLVLLKSGDGKFTLPNWVLTVLVGITGVAFVFFNGRYLRLHAEEMDRYVTHAHEKGKCCLVIKQGCSFACFSLPPHCSTNPSAPLINPAVAPPLSQQVVSPSPPSTLLNSADLAALYQVGDVNDLLKNKPSLNSSKPVTPTHTPSYSSFSSFGSLADRDRDASTGRPSSVSSESPSS
jgi:hypothetical protein